MGFLAAFAIPILAILILTIGGFITAVFSVIKAKMSPKEDKEGRKRLYKHAGCCMIPIFIVMGFIIIGIIDILSEKAPMQMTNDEIKAFYYENKEMFNDIRDTMQDNISFETSWDGFHLLYANNQLTFFHEDDGERFESIKSIHDDAVNFFKLLENGINPQISIRKGDFYDISVVSVVYFRFYDFYHRTKKKVTGIVYTTDPQPTDELIEGNWYIYRWEYRY